MLEIDKDEDEFDWRKFMDEWRADPEAVEARLRGRGMAVAERKYRGLMYKEALIQQRRAAERAGRQASQLPEVPLVADEDYWTSLLDAGPPEGE